jgi:hypothetical protein
MQGREPLLEAQSGATTLSAQIITLSEAVRVIAIHETFTDVVLLIDE